MLCMRVIGLTGNIGTGKSTVGAMLGILGARVIDADIVAHRLLDRENPAALELLEVFGPEIANPDGMIDRRKLATRVFGDASAVRDLNRIIHARLQHVIQAEIDLARQDGVEVLVLESPLLFEVDWSMPLLDEAWVTVCPVETIMGRLTLQRGMTEEEIRSRLAAQLSGQEKAKRACQVIDTNCTKEELQKRVLELWKSIAPVGD
jgi:dephospho-CoA kinase